VASPLDLDALADAVLAAAVDALDTIPGFAPAFEGAPERTYVGVGLSPALFCPGIIVNVAPSIREAATNPLGLGAGTRHKQGFRKNHVGVQVWFTRCRPQDIPPNPAAMTAHAGQHHADGWAMWNYMWNINRQGSADPLVSLCDEWFMDSLTPLQESGTLSGWMLALRVELAGYGDGANPGGTPP
jgi:hypothetical protein